MGVIKRVPWYRGVEVESEKNSNCANQLPPLVPVFSPHPTPSHVHVPYTRTVRYPTHRSLPPSMASRERVDQGTHHPRPRPVYPHMGNQRSHSTTRRSLRSRECRHVVHERPGSSVFDDAAARGGHGTCVFVLAAYWGCVRTGVFLQLYGIVVYGVSSE